MYQKTLKSCLGGRHDTFDITVKDVKNGTAQSREDKEFYQELESFINQKKMFTTIVTVKVFFQDLESLKLFQQAVRH
ncbi:MAG: hypothetical protein CM15mP126_7700 [Gammaproteobacteria bacterium]|nr:MAG: hypothetical protein CM15mP126_7700 [Gammaproteobacteria bacterium]